MFSATVFLNIALYLFSVDSTENNKYQYKQYNANCTKPFLLNIKYELNVSHWIFFCHTYIHSIIKSGSNVTFCRTCHSRYIYFKTGTVKDTMSKRNMLGACAVQIVDVRHMRSWPPQLFIIKPPSRLSLSTFSHFDNVGSCWTLLHRGSPGSEAWGSAPESPCRISSRSFTYVLHV